MFIKNDLIVAADIDGGYKLDMNPSLVQYDSIKITYIGYKPKTIGISLDGGGEYTVLLELDNIRLDEFTVTGKRSTLTSKEIMKRARKSIKSLYHKDDVQGEGFYRELLYEDEKCVELNEAVFQTNFTGYPQKRYLKKAFRHYFSNNYKSLFTAGTGLYFSYPLYRIYYNTIHDKVNIQEGRSSDFFGTNIQTSSPKGGPNALLALDRVKYQTDFLDKKLASKYNFTKNGVVEIENRLYYLISFKPEEQGQIFRIQNHKKPKEAIFTGNMYIDIENFAIKKLEFRFSENANFNSYSRPNQCRKISDIVDVSIVYEQVNGKFIVNHVSTEQTLFKSPDDYCAPFSQNLKCKRQLWLNDVDFLNKPFPFRGENCFYQHPYGNLKDFLVSYNPDFWKDYIKNKYYPAILTSDKESLEKFKPLSTQYKNRFHQLDLPIPKAIQMADSIIYFDSIQVVDSFKWMQIDPKELSSYVDQENKFFKNFMIPYRKNHYRIYSALTNKVKLCNEAIPTVQDLRLDFSSEGDLCLLEQSNEQEETKLINFDSLGIYRQEIRSIRRNYDKTKIFVKIHSRKDKNILLIKDANNIYNYPIDERYIGDVFWLDENIITYFVKNINGHNEHLDYINTHTNSTGRVLSIPTIEYELDYKLTNFGTPLIYTRNSGSSIVHTINTTGDIPLAVPLEVENNFQIFDVHENEYKWYVHGNYGQNKRAIFSKEKNNPKSVLKQIISDADSMYIRNFDILPDGILVKYTAETKSRIQVFSFEGVKKNDLTFSEDYFSLSSNYNPNDSIPEISYSSPNDPESRYYWNAESTEFQDSTFLCFHNTSNHYETSVSYVKSEDNVEIPISIITSSSNKQPKAIFVKVYGAYEAFLDHRYDDFDHYLLDKGFVIVKAHTRGGEAKGLPWAISAKNAKKQLSIDDYLTCLEYIRKNGILGTKKIIGYGQSAGGLVVSGAVNKSPYLFDAVILDHGYFDVVNTMMDSLAYLTPLEYNEFGDPRDSNQLRKMISYSPYENITEKNFPPMLFLSGRKDKSTPLWQNMKMVAKYRSTAKDPNQILSFTSSFGHPGSIPYADRMKQLMYASIFLDNIIQ